MEKEEFNHFFESIFKTTSQIRSGVIGGVAFIATLAVGIASLNPTIPIMNILILDFLIGLIFYVYLSIGIIQNQKRINKLISSLTIPEFCLGTVRGEIARMPSEVIRPSNTESAPGSIDDLFALQNYMIVLFSASHFRYFELLEDALKSETTYKKPFIPRRDSAMILVASGYIYYMQKKEELKKNEYVKSLDKKVSKGLIAVYPGAHAFKGILEYYDQLPDDPYWSHQLINAICDSLGGNRLTLARFLSTIYEVPESELFVKEQLLQKLKVVGALLAAAIPIGISIVQLLLPLLFPSNSKQ
jgi:hypothetical protein